MFDTTKTDLAEILRHAHEGRLQLPDFQRSYVWGDGDVRALIASIARGFPVGALLTLETGGEVRFKPRGIEGAPEPDRGPDTLLLDGQQRITSLYQALHSPTPVRTRRTSETTVDRHYYLDMRAALAEGGDMEEAVIGVPANRVVTSNIGRDVDLDLSSPEREYDQGMFPLDRTFDFRTWSRGWYDHWRDRAGGREMLDLERDFEDRVLTAIQTYKMPVIKLDKSNGREAICLIFEKVNVGGRKLDAFELVTAIFAGDGFDLREDWMGPEGGTGRDGRHGRIVYHDGYGRRETLTGVSSVDFLQACTFMHTRERRMRREREGVTGRDLPPVALNRDALLALPLDAYRRHADAVEEGFRRADVFLNHLKIMRARDVPYPPQIVALAAFHAASGDKPLSLPQEERLAQWFWTVALGEVYGSATETKIARDVSELLSWIHEGGLAPRVIRETAFREDRLMTLRTRNSAAYDALHALLMAKGCRDFITGNPVEVATFHHEKMDIHHIFPRAWCESRGLDRGAWNSIVNKTALSAASNRSIGGRAPSEYLRRIETERGLGEAELDAILHSHLIEPDLLRADDFDGFIAARRRALADLVGRVVEHVVRDAPPEEPEEDAPSDEDATEGEPT